MKRFTLLLFASVLGIAVQARGQLPELINDPEFRPVARQAVDSLYNMNPEASRELLEPWKQRYPEHPLWTLFEGMELWWEILSDLEDTSHDERFYSIMGRADYQSSRLLRKQSSHADALIIKAISNGYIARQYANRDEWISSMNQSRKAYSAYQYLLELQPDLPDLQMAEGLKLYYSDYLPEAYPIVKTVSWFLPDGDRQKGLELLAEAAENSIFAQAEARYFLGNIHLQYEENYRKAARHLEQLHEAYPNNSYYVRILVRSYHRMDREEEALKKIHNALARWRNKELPYQDVLMEDLLTIKGRILYSQGRTSEAIEAFRRAYETGFSLPLTATRKQHAVSGFYAGFLLYRTGKLQEAEKFFREVEDLKGSSEYVEKASEWLKKTEEKN